MMTFVSSFSRVGFIEFSSSSSSSYSFSRSYSYYYSIQLKMKRYVGYIGITALGGQFVRLVGDGMRTAG